MPTVADADALNLLARAPSKLPAGWIITPHPGEAARLLGTEIPAVQADRLGAARELHSRYGAVVVLKGAGTLVASGAAGAAELAICERGNPGMATAGMGDVLTGVIAGLRAQSGDSARAARVGVLVHALAGDSAAQGGQRGLIALGCHRRAARLGESVTGEPAVWLTAQRRGNRSAGRALVRHGRRRLTGRRAAW